MSAGGGTDRRTEGRTEGSSGARGGLRGQRGRGAGGVRQGRAGRSAARPGLGARPWGLEPPGGVPLAPEGTAPAGLRLPAARCAASPLGAEPGRDGQLMEKGIAELRRW